MQLTKNSFTNFLDSITRVNIWGNFAAFADVEINAVEMFTLKDDGVQSKHINTANKMAPTVIKRLNCASEKVHSTAFRSVVRI